MKYLSLLFLLILISCNSNNDNITLYLCDIEQKVINVKQTPVEVLNKEPLGHPFFIDNIKDKYLVITDIDARDKGLYIYNIDNFKPLGVTGKLGEGPGEISFYSLTVPYENGFIMQDNSKRLYYYYDINNAIEEKHYLPQEITQYTNKKIFPFHYKMLNESNYIGVIMKATSNSTYGNLSKLVFLFDPICSVNLGNLTYNSVYF
ncbi:hypothetical protein K5X82_08060 [Halosquirtibacter xylanolyticus]|uniref:hypothetical protein n=1 Tax=Halosquirtibacter xylanolyticus TaxID=3374599 RepID=UPI003747FC11|nr:hypothetical protein K5X82_08060 [Prolixibacteraceae bacterium]